MNLHTLSNQSDLANCYKKTLLHDVFPFWMQHGIDRDHGGFLTALDRDGTLIDSDKSIWFQGRGAWMFATLYNTVENNSAWLDAARSGIEFIRRFGASADGKLYFSVTRDGQPLRMRRYVYSEAFAAMANATYSRASGDAQAADDSIRFFETYLSFSFEPGRMQPKTDPQTRAMISIGPLMIAINIAQEVRNNIGDMFVQGRTCTAWIDWAINRIEHFFLKHEHQALLEIVSPDGAVIDHFEGRQLNPGHAIECAWFILHEGKARREQRYIKLGITILEYMWKRGWDDAFGGFYYFRDLHGKPVQDYWHDMKFWWPHCEAIITTLLAWSLTGEKKYAKWHRQVHEWSFHHFPDPEYGEWYGYLHRDGGISCKLKGNMWKGPFHLPRMLWYCWQLLENS